MTLKDLHGNSLLDIDLSLFLGPPGIFNCFLLLHLTHGLSLFEHPGGEKIEDWITNTTLDSILGSSVAQWVVPVSCRANDLLLYNISHLFTKNCTNLESEIKTNSSIDWASLKGIEGKEHITYRMLTIMPLALLNYYAFPDVSSTNTMHKCTYMHKSS